MLLLKQYCIALLELQACNTIYKFKYTFWANFIVDVRKCLIITLNYYVFSACFFQKIVNKNVQFWNCSWFLIAFDVIKWYVFHVIVKAIVYVP